MSRRVLYILIVVVVLIVGIFVIRPMLTRKGGGGAPAVTRKVKKVAATDTVAEAAKSTKARGKVRAAKEKAAAKSATAKTAVPAKAKEAPATAATAEKTDTLKAETDTTTLTWGGDPFVRDWLLAGELRDLKLRAITIGERSLALINDRIVARGDTINGKRVAEIARDSVVFEFGGQKRGLKIGE